MEATILLYVTFMSYGTCARFIKEMVLVPFGICVSMPYDRHPKLFAKTFMYNFWLVQGRGICIIALFWLPFDAQVGFALWEKVNLVIQKHWVSL